MAPTEVHMEAVNGIMMWVSGEILGAVEFAISVKSGAGDHSGVAPADLSNVKLAAGNLCRIPMGFVPTRPGWRGRRNNHPGNGQFRADRAARPGTRAQSPWCLSRRRFSFYGNFCNCRQERSILWFWRISTRCYHTWETDTDMTDGGLVCESSTSGKRGPTELQDCVQQSVNGACACTEPCEPCGQ